MIGSEQPTWSIRGFYEEEDLPYGTAYVWRGTSGGEEGQPIEDQRLSDEVLHPWRYRRAANKEDQLPY